MRGHCDGTEGLNRTKLKRDRGTRQSQEGDGGWRGLRNMMEAWNPIGAEMTLRSSRHCSILEPGHCQGWGLLLCCPLTLLEDLDNVVGTNKLAVG